MPAASPPTWPVRHHADSPLRMVLSVPDMESLDEITDEDVQELLLAMASPTGSHGRVLRLTDVEALAEDDPVAPYSAEVAYTREGQPAQQQRPQQPPLVAPGVYAAGRSRRVSLPQDPMPSPMTTEFHSTFPCSRRRTSVASPLQQNTPLSKSNMFAEPNNTTLASRSSTLTSPLSTTLGSPTNTQDSRVECRSEASPLPPSPSASQALPRLVPISDTEVLEAELHRWDSQLVQECWLHQELHGVRWDEELLLQHGAAYRPRAIASRTTVSMTHSKRLCIALNVETSVVENAEGALSDEKGEGGGGEAAGMPSMSSPEAEAWSPLFMWRSPAFILGDSSAVLAQLSERLSEQYKGLAPRPLPTTCCANARPSDLIQALSDARKDAGNAKVIFHYVARGVPPPRGGNLYLMNVGPSATGYAGPPYSKLSLDTFRSRVGFPLVFVADCAEAGEILNYYIRMCEEQHQQRYFTSSREYQLMSSRQVSEVEMDAPADSQASRINSNYDRVGSNLDTVPADSLHCGGHFGAGGMDSAAPPQSTILQDFYFIGATGCTDSGNGGASGSGSSAMRSRMGVGRGDAGMMGVGAAAGGAAGGGRAVCDGDAGALRHHPRLPSDILTSCLTTTLRMAILWFVAERPELQALHPLILHLFPGTLTDKKTPLGQLQWYLQCITECIAWSTLSLPQYSRLFREDVYVAPLFRGYLLAERIIVGGLGGCLSVYPPVPATHSHRLWSTWDNIVERSCVSLLRAVRPAPPHCASVLEFRSWLDVQVTSWKYSRPDLLAAEVSNAVPAAAASPGAEAQTSCLPSLPDDAAVVIPPFLAEELLGLQAMLDGITQQSFELPRAYSAGVWGLQPRSSTSAAWGGTSTTAPGADGRDEAGEVGREKRRPYVCPTSGRVQGRNGRGAAARVPLSSVADQYVNSLQSSYPRVPQQPQQGTAISPPSDGLARLTVASRSSVALPNSSESAAAAAGLVWDRHTQSTTAAFPPRASNRCQDSRKQRPTAPEGAVAVTSGVPKRAESRATVTFGGYQRVSNAHLSRLSNAAAMAAVPAASAASDEVSVLHTTALSRAVTQGPPVHVGVRKTEYITNLFTSTTTSGQAASFHYTADLYRPADALESTAALGNLYSCSSTAATATAASEAHPPQQTFPFMERMPSLLQALLVAAHRERATELVCRLVDCGPAAVLQCAEANIYRLVLDRYWTRPDLRFLMPATLFIYCKSCYADPELIGSAKQREVAVKACAEILQCPVEVPPSTSSAGGDEVPGAWQSNVLGPYATPYGQRMMAASLLTLIALHSDDGREACHQRGVFQLCCQLLQQAQEEAPLWLAATEASTAPATTPGATAALPVPRVLSFSQKLHVSSPPPALRLQRPATPLCEAGDEPPHMAPPPVFIATTYHLTLLTFFVSLLCSWKLPVTTPAAEEEDHNTEREEEGVSFGSSPADVGTSFPGAAPTDPPSLSPPLDGTVQDVPQTSAEVLEAGLHAAAPALLHFMYSDTSILRGAAQRCFMMVLISPAPSQASRARYAELQLHRLHGLPVRLSEMNTDLRLEATRMAYTAYRWLFAQLREDIPVEEIGQYVAQWMYRWFRLAAKGKPPPPPSIFGDKNFCRGSGQQTSLRAHGSSAPSPQHQQQVAHSVWAPPTVSVSYHGPHVVTPGSISSHCRSNVLVPAARSARVGMVSDSATGGGIGSVVLGGGLRHHVMPQDHRRLQAYLPPLSNLVRLFFEHTQDTCPYVRTYVRRVVLEEFSFLRQSWYDDYTVMDPQRRTSPSPVAEEDDYSGAGRHHYPGHQRRQRHASGSRQSYRHIDRHHGVSGESGPGCGGEELEASSAVSGGGLATYLPLKQLFHVREETAHGGGPAATSLFGMRTMGASPMPMSSDFEVGHWSVAAAAASAGDVEDVAEPHPAVLRRFIVRLLRIASSNSAEGATASPMSPLRPHSHYRIEAAGAVGGKEGDEVDGGGGDTRQKRRCGVRGLRCSGEMEVGQGGFAVRTGARGGTSSTATTRRRGAGDRGVGPQDGDDYFASELQVGSEGVVGGSGMASMLLDAEAFALHPLWTLDSTAMMNFAYGALSFLERFMLEETDDSDPRHPMNLEKENALYEYSQRVECNIRASAQEAAAGVVDGGRCSGAPLLAVRDREQLSRTAGSTAPLPTALRAYAPFQCIGVGDIGRAGVPGCGRRGASASSSSPDSSATRCGGGVGAAALSLSRVAGNVDVILFHPSEPMLVTSTTGGLLSVWSYEPAGKAAADEVEATQDAANNDRGEDGYERSVTARGPRRGPISSLRALEARAQYFLRDVVGRANSAMARVAQPRYMYDRYNPHGQVPARRAGGAIAAAKVELEARRLSRTVYGTGKDVSAAAYRRDEASGLGGGGSRPGMWMERAEAANAAAALPSSYRHGHLHYYHGVGDLHLVDAAYRPLLCAVRRTGAVEMFSDFADRREVRRVTTFETMPLDQREEQHHCVSSYQPPTGLLYVSTQDGGVSAWDLGSEQRLAVSGRFSSAAEDSAAVSALMAHPCTPYEYVVGSYGMPVCVFDLRDGVTGAARRGMSLPSLRCGIRGGLVSPFCLRVSYSRRYPNAVVAGYADGTVAVWDRRYAKQPCILFGAARDSPYATDLTSSEGHAASAVAPRMIRQLDTHPSSKLFLTLMTTPSSLQLVQPWRGDGRAGLAHTDGAGGSLLPHEGPLKRPTTSLLHQFSLDNGSSEDTNDGSGGGSSGPGAACFHDFSPVLGVGVGSTVQLYGTLHLTSAAAYLERGLA
ncbi:conserved hypothetical protein [Leishmania major strain Friedlin]|uniref:Raptor N-terminal CASPase-like domain-containing protein n=1 Tax=Leishmania major TaxID=5664 RepID=Q4QCS2_LEIMA|nr:conserved hypothetical protein [Leishmania major strain Friedlin]CAG9573197.1 Raptor_N-terminal_CASPase_like_domain_containing_protein_-_putative [Leishmania major strain Friedlin]CAJ04224.1 conserved hypothetical protein [Leishmania major strain Friedlin]|eukprot:XP_001682876.1 conserved hypothetical protein [Leishmania major strain Friedlin]